MDRFDRILLSSEDWNKQFDKTDNLRESTSRSAGFSKHVGRLMILLFLTLLLTPLTTQASLGLAIAVNPEPAAAGEYLHVALTVSNTSAFDRSDVVLQMRYPEHLSVLHNSLISDGGYAPGATSETQEFVTWELGTLAAGSTKTVTLPPQVDPSTPAGEVIEFAPRVSDNSGDEAMASRNVIVESERILELTLAADAEPVEPGDLLTYTITYGHRAASAIFPDAIVELPLPNGVNFVSATGGGILAGDTVHWSLGTLNPGQVGRIQVMATVDSSVALGGMLQAQAVLRSTSLMNVIARADTVTVVETAHPLLLSVEVLPEPAAAGEYLHVALTVSNTSVFDRSDVVLRIRYPEHLSVLHNSLLSDGGYAPGATSDFREFVTWELGTLKAGSAITVTLPPQVAPGTAAGTVIEFAPRVSDSTGQTRTVSRCVPVESERVLELVLAADKEPVQPGDLLTYTVTYGHRATSAIFPDAIVELPLPNGVNFVSATGGGILAGDTVHWSLGTLNPEQVGRIQVMAAVDSSVALGGMLQAQAVLRSTSLMNVIARADTVTVVETAHPLLLSAEVLPEPAAAGEYLHVALTVSNTSVFDRSDVVLRMRYPEHLSVLHNSLISDGGYAPGPTSEFREFVTWELGTLKAGSAITVTLPPQVAASTPAGSVIEFAPWVSDSTGQTRTVSRCVPVENERILELVLNVDRNTIQPGDLLTYILTYGHKNLSSVMLDTHLELPLPDGLSFVSATGGGIMAGDRIQWSLGTLNPGQVGRMQVTTAVDSSAALGSMLQTQAVLLSTSRPDVIARADAVATVVSETPLLLSMAVLPDPAVAGEQLDTTLTVSNTSTFDRANVVLRMRYPEHLSVLHYSLLSDGGYAPGPTSEFREFVTWELGTLRAGSTKTVTLPPLVDTATIDGTIITFEAVVSDATARSRTQHTVQIGQPNASVFGTVILTNSYQNITLPTGSDAVIYGTAEPNYIIIGNGAKAELINFPGQNTIEIQSDSSSFRVSRSGAVVTFTGSDGTVLKIPATKDAQTISFHGEAGRVLQIDNNQVKLGSQEITITAAQIHGS